MSVFDLHCDTLTRERKTRGEIDVLNNPRFNISLSKMPPKEKWVQCFAIFMPDEIRGGEATKFFDRIAAVFRRQAELHRDRLLPCNTFADIETATHTGKCAAILTVEGGSALAGRLEQVEYLHSQGVRMMTLTWNGPNELASGSDTTCGFTAFGREAVAEMERRNILVDVSHLNDRSFEELLGFVKKPFAASHSNARAVCSHSRNLPDAFIKEMARRECLIGLNFCNEFLSNDNRGSMDDLYRHVCHFLNLGAEHCLALGSDYDGAGFHPDLDSMEKSFQIKNYLISHGIPAQTAEDITFSNAWQFFKKWMK